MIRDEHGDPTPCSDEQALAAALRFVNEVRVVVELDPITALPKGTQSSTVCCPVARGLLEGAPDGWVRVYPSRARLGLVGRDSVMRELPYTVATFVGRFDDGVYPDLVDTTSP